MHKFHFSIDDVLGSLLQLSDWNLKISQQPMLAFLAELHAETGVKSDLYLFLQTIAADGRTRHLKELSGAACEMLRSARHLRYGPHARDYQTAPHAETVYEVTQGMTHLFENIERFSTPDQRSDWVRLHYFSELHELASFWTRHNVQALMTTDKPAVAYRFGQQEIEELTSTGKTEFNGLGFVRSNLRLEFFLEDAADPERFCARMDDHLARQGFVTIFTHEDDLNDERVRKLVAAAARHAQELGIISD